MFDWFALVVLPLIIFFARIIDVGLGTIRVIFISRGHKAVSTVIAFVEISVWLLAAREVFGNLDSPLYALAYAAGFAAGTYIGLFISEHLTIGKVLVRVITRRPARRLIARLKERGYRLTWMDAQSSQGHVNVMFFVVDSDRMEEMTRLIKKFNPRAFYSVEDVRRVSTPTKLFPAFFPNSRKGK
ncbi:DUF2179 domain-containing protein [Candidatus Woesearchaeota archaeon]|nr:DUF2179 domain-containing protein [Candidatus Woesearchaeota archaeon]